MPRSNFTVRGGATIDSSTLFVDDPNNRVGIGTTSPQQTLDVSGVIKGSSGVISLTTAGVPSATLDDGAFSVDTTNHHFYYRSGATWRRLVSTAGDTITGNVTIGPGRFIANGSGFYFASDATYYDPTTNIPPLVVRVDEAQTGVRGSRAALVLYNANGGINTGAGLTFASREQVNTGNDVALAGIFGIKESAGTSGSWSLGGLRFWTKQGPTVTEAMVITNTGFVGIGNTNPGHRVDISGGSVLIRGVSAVSSLNWNTDGGTATYSRIEVNNDANSGTSMRFSTLKSGVLTEQVRITDQGRVGIGTGSPSEILHVVGNTTITGSLSAATKSFDIAHPSKPGYRLRYGSVEAPEHSVQVRGRSTSGVIDLPDHWVDLVDPATITVHLTPVGHRQNLFVKRFDATHVVVGGSWRKGYFYTVSAERKDVPKLVVEYGDHV